MVPAVTVARFDDGGTPTAVETNNDKPPLCSDLFFVSGSMAGSGLQQGTLRQENRVIQLDRARHGGWKQGWNLLRSS
ncbi:MAG TPA: hypothetical protein VHW47_03165 [Acidimicrobiales bacterium]|nr:hypothetical protein [Acidimicrobiales bacterium]